MAVMLATFGLIVLLAAVSPGVVGVLNNNGETHALVGDFTVFGYPRHRFHRHSVLYGMAVGAVATRASVRSRSPSR